MGDRLTAALLGPLPGFGAGDPRAGMRAYEEASSHHKNPGMLAQAASNQLSCISSGCHDTVHDVSTLKDAIFWTPKGNPK